MEPTVNSVTIFSRATMLRPMSWQRKVPVLLVLTWAIRGSIVSSQTIEFPENRPLSYSAVQVTEGEDPHAYGVSVEFCRVGNVWTGYFSEHVGPVADPPAGKLNDVALSGNAGTVSFTARLALGLTLREAEWVPAQVMYGFSGRIGRDAIVGVLTKEQAGRATSEEIVLERNDDAAAIEMSCDQWSDVWQRRIDLRNSTGQQVIRSTGMQ